jgi:DNA-binding GntR family transcriptional regulator
MPGAKQSRPSGPSVGASRAAADDWPGDRLLTNRRLLSVAPAPNGLHVPTYKQAAYEALRDMVIELELPPGTRLVEADLARRLQVSKTPIREALGLLELDGLIEFAPYRGATVRWMNLAEMEEQAYLVDAIELPVLPRLAEQITDRELADVGVLVQELKAARRARAGRRYRRLTSEYHRVLYTPTGYPRLVRLVESLIFPVGLRYDRVFCDNFPRAWDAHLQLMTGRYEALQKRDAAATVEVVRAGRLRLGDAYLSHVSDPLVAPYFTPG